MPVSDGERDTHAGFAEHNATLATEHLRNRRSVPSAESAEPGQVHGDVQGRLAAAGEDPLQRRDVGVVPAVSHPDVPWPYR